MGDNYEMSLPCGYASRMKEIAEFLSSIIIEIHPGGEQT